MPNDLLEGVGLLALSVVLIVLLLGVASWLWRLGAWLEKPRVPRKGAEESVSTAEAGPDDMDGVL